MRSKGVFFAAVLACMGFLAYGCSERPGADKDPGLKSSNTAADSVAVGQPASSGTWNKFCPVQGWAVDPKSPTLTYKGKVIGFCCPHCDETFNEDPDRYLRNLSEDGSQFNIGG